MLVMYLETSNGHATIAPGGGGLTGRERVVLAGLVASHQMLHCLVCRKVDGVCRT